MTFSVHELPSIYATFGRENQTASQIPLVELEVAPQREPSLWWNPAAQHTTYWIHRPTIRATHSNMSLPRFYWELIRKKVE